MSEEPEQALSILTTPRAGADQVQVCEAGPRAGGLGFLYVCALGPAYISGPRDRDPRYAPLSQALLNSGSGATQSLVPSLVFPIPSNITKTNSWCRYLPGTGRCLVGAA